MASSTFGTGWPACDRSNVVTLVRKDGLRIPIHRDLVDLVQICLDVTEAMGYDVLPGQTWGYACRAIAGTSTPSNHSWGTATDINAPSNPRRKRGLPMVTNLPRRVIDFWKAQGFRWGGDYAWPDPMHFEWMGTAAQARATAANLRRFFAAAGGKTPPRAQPTRFPKPAPRPYPKGMPVSMGSTGRAVEIVQQVLRERGYDILVDGDFGPATNHVVVHWQRGHRLKDDGEVGEATWHSLLFA